jgi:hypothetical protein
MYYIAGAIGLLVVTGLLFRFALPRGGRPRWFIGTIWEPTLGIVFSLAAVGSLALLLAGVGDLLAGG